MIASRVPGPPRRRAAEAGLSLVETLVALAVVGVLGGAAVLTLGARGPSAEAEARRLADRIGVALDETLASDRDVALVWGETGYAFETRDPETGAWAPFETGALAKREPARGAALRTTPRAGRALIGPDAFTAPLRFALGEGRGAWTVAFDGVAIDVEPAEP